MSELLEKPFAGDTTRPDVNYLQTVQTVMYNFKKGWWWVIFDTRQP